MKTSAPKKPIKPGKIRYNSVREMLVKTSTPKKVVKAFDKLVRDTKNQKP